MTIIQHKRGTASEWTAAQATLGATPILAAGEIGYETDTNKFKIGDGTSIWGDLDYFESGAGSTTNSFTTISTPSGTSPVADSSTDTLTLTAGTGITITGNSTTDTIEIATTGLQPLDAELTAIAGLTSAADKLPYFTGSETASLATFTSFGRSLIDDADASAGRTTLGLGTMATQASTSYAALSGATFTGNVLIQTAGTAALSIGRVDGTSSTPYIDFNSGATAIDYDSRIIASGGTGTTGQGDLAFYAASSTFNGNVVLAGTSASTDIRTLEITSQGFARIDMTGDSANAAGEPGGAAITFAVDSTASTYGIVSAVNAAGGSGVSGISYTGSLDNSMLVGTNGALPLTLGTNNNVRLTIDSAGDATFTGTVTASSFSGNASTATTATNADNINISTTTGNAGAVVYPVFVAANTTGNQTPHTDVGGFTYNATANSIQTGAATFTGDVAVNGGDLTTTAATFNLINTNATTLNIGGAATTISMGAGTGNVLFNDNISAEGYITARRASNQDSVRLLGRAGGTGNYDAVITPTTLTASRTFTLPNASGTLGITEIEIGNAVNLNDLTTTGTYIQSSNAEAAAGTNYPEAVAGTLRVVANSNTSEVWQTYHTLGGGSTNRVYQRGYYITWSAWKEVVTTDGITYATSGASAIESSHYYALSSTRNLVTQTAAQSVFGVGLALAASTTYEYEMLVAITHNPAGVSSTMNTLFAYSGTLTSSNAHIQYSTNATGFSTGSAISHKFLTAVTSSTGLSSSTSGQYIVYAVRGLIRTNTTGTLTPQISLSSITSYGGVPVVQSSSYIKVKPIGSNTVTTVGAWA